MEAITEHRQEGAWPRSAVFPLAPAWLLRSTPIRLRGGGCGSSKPSGVQEVSFPAAAAEPAGSHEGASEDAVDEGHAARDVAVHDVTAHVAEVDSTVAAAIFEALDADRSGTIEQCELREYLLAAGRDQQTIDDLFRTLDANSDGHISREEWRHGVGRYMEAQEVAPTEQRAISVAQLRDVREAVRTRCDTEEWCSTNPERADERLRPEQVTLYDLTELFLKKATQRRRCSYVTLVAERAQSPKWFVSHWCVLFVLSPAARRPHHSSLLPARARSFEQLALLPRERRRVGAHFECSP